MRISYYHAPLKPIYPRERNAPLLFRDPVMTLSGPQYMLISAASFAGMGAMVKAAGIAGIPLMEILFSRAIVSLLLSLADCWRLGINPLGQRRDLLLLRGIVGFLALSCFFYSMLHLPYAEATVVQYTHPIFTALLAYLIIHEKTSKATLVCIVFSMMGLVVMASPSLNMTAAQQLSHTGLAAGIAGAFGAGLAYTIVRKLSRTDHPSVIVLYFPLVCVPAALVSGFDQFVMPQGSAWWVLLGVGVFTHGGQVSLTRAMAVDSASRSASLSYIQIVFATILGFIIFGEIPARTTVLGGALILLGAWSNIWLTRKIQLNR
jgi:drug/metabolite transporter (DMT)-like permease